MLCLNIGDVTIITFKGIDYYWLAPDISKYDAIHLFENSALDARGYIQNTFQRNQCLK